MGAMDIHRFASLRPLAVEWVGNLASTIYNYGRMILMIVVNVAWTCSMNSYMVTLVVGWIAMVAILSVGIVVPI